MAASAEQAGALDCVAAHVRAVPYPRERLPMWVIYDHPKDYPDTFVARLWVILPSPSATPYAVTHANIAVLRTAFADIGLTRQLRSSTDDPVILETWL